AAGHDGAHGVPQPSPGIAGEPEQVAGRLVDEQPRPIEMLAEGAPLEILDDADGRMGRAGAELLLVLYWAAPRPQIDAGRQAPGSRQPALDRLRQPAEAGLYARMTRSVVTRIHHRREPARADFPTAAREPYALVGQRIRHSCISFVGKWG